MEITAMDWIRATLANAMVEDMTLEDVARCAEYAVTVEDFDTAVNELAQTQEGGANVFIMTLDDLRNLFG